MLPSPTATSPASTAKASRDAASPDAPLPAPVPRKRHPKRRTLSCLPCRQHKLKCDRHVPCLSCTRYRREDQCRQHPAPEAQLNRVPLPRPRVTIAPVTGSATGPATTSDVSADGASYLSRSHGTPHLPPLYETIREAQLLGARNSSGTAASGGQSNGTGIVQEPVPNLLKHSVSGLAASASHPLASMASESFWKAQLVALLPTQNQCDLLLCYYLENINWVYQAIHVPSFRNECSKFWNSNLEDVDLIWLSLLYTIISLSALYVPPDMAEAVGFKQSAIRELAHVWHNASRQALYAGGFESKPCLTQLSTFLVTQLYWLATKNAEAMNSCLGQAVRNAQALGLDKDMPGANILEMEMRRRIWWELWGCDTFQSFCLGRTPLIHTPASRVPTPSNCNDIDITPTSLNPRPMSEPTELSANICRAEAFKILRKIFNQDSSLLLSWPHIRAIDAEIQALLDDMPWYLRISPTGETAKLPPGLDFLGWQHHILHSCIAMQRIRMHRPFLRSQDSSTADDGGTGAWAVCTKAAQDVLAVYRNLRDPDQSRFRRSQKFFVQAYQIYTAAVALAAFLLVERSFPATTIRKDIEMVIQDLELRDDAVGFSMIADGKKVLRRMLEMYDNRAKRQEPVEQESLVREISAVFGGENTTRKYLRRCDIGYVLNAASSAPQKPQTADSPAPLRSGVTQGAGVEEGRGNGAVIQFPGTTIGEIDMLGASSLDAGDFDLALDILNCEQWDLLLPDIVGLST